MLTGRKWTLLVVLLLVPLGFATKWYNGPAAFWVNNSLGGVLYVVFWSLLLSVGMPRIRFGLNVVVVFTVTSVVELLQLWHPPVLQLVRGHFLGATLLGTCFSWSDFPHYAIGALMAFALLNAVSGLEKR